MVSSKSIVNIPNSGIVADQIKIGDLLLTHKREWCPVLQIKKSYQKLWEFRSSCRNNKLYLTEDQIILTNKGWRLVSKLKPNIDSIAISQEISFVEFPEQPQEIDDRYGIEGLFFCPVRELNETNIRGDVINFLVRGGNSYSCDGLVVKGG